MHHTDARDLYQWRREILPMNFASKSVIHENPLGSFTCHKAGTWDILFYFPSEGRYTEDFPDTWKIQRLRPGLNPWTRVPVASMLTTRPPKPSAQWCSVKFQNTRIFRNNYCSFWISNETQIYLVNETNRHTEFQFCWYYDSTCFGQPFCPSPVVLSRTLALVHFCRYDDHLLLGAGSCS